MEDNKTQKILKAKIDWHKTWITISLGGTITTSVAAIAYKDDLANTAFFLVPISFLVSFFITLAYYISRHHQLMDELYRK